MMNKKIDIEKIGKRNPYIVPKDYFLALTHNIMDKIDTPKKRYLFYAFQLQTIVPIFAIVVIIFSGLWYNNQNTNISDDDLVELLAFYNVEEDLILEYIDFEKEEETDEYLMEQFDYHELLYEL